MMLSAKEGGKLEHLVVFHMTQAVFKATTPTNHLTSISLYKVFSELTYIIFLMIYNQM